jgi:hypothetical protein
MVTAGESNLFKLHLCILDINFGWCVPKMGAVSNWTHTVKRVFQMLLIKRLSLFEVQSCFEYVEICC